MQILYNKRDPLKDSEIRYTLQNGANVSPTSLVLQIDDGEIPYTFYDSVAGRDRLLVLQIKDQQVEKLYSLNEKSGEKPELQEISKATCWNTNLNFDGQALSCTLFFDLKNKSGEPLFLRINDPANAGRPFKRIAPGNMLANALNSDNSSPNQPWLDVASSEIMAAMKNAARQIERQENLIGSTAQIQKTLFSKPPVKVEKNTMAITSPAPQPISDPKEKQFSNRLQIELNKLNSADPQEISRGQSIFNRLITGVEQELKKITKLTSDVNFDASDMQAAATALSLTAGQALQETLANLYEMQRHVQLAKPIVADKEKATQLIDLAQKINEQIQVIKPLLAKVTSNIVDKLAIEIPKEIQQIADLNKGNKKTISWYNQTLNTKEGLLGSDPASAKNELRKQVAHVVDFVEQVNERIAKLEAMREKVKVAQGMLADSISPRQQGQLSMQLSNLSGKINGQIQVAKAFITELNEHKNVVHEKLKQFTPSPLSKGPSQR